jgi:hypothetical protein
VLVVGGGVGEGTAVVFYAFRKFKNLMSKLA